MIVGIFLRYFKTYQGINYIPLTDEDNFCGLLGNNGVGKSSVLEALDTFFNLKSWNFNVATKKSGLSSTKPHIVPIFLLKKSHFKPAVLEKAEILSNFAKSIIESDVHLSVKTHIKKYVEHRSLLENKMQLDDFLLIPIGVDYEGGINLSLFNNHQLAREIYGTETERTNLDSQSLNEFLPLLNAIRESIEYIYIPREIDPQSFTKLETKEIQVLMGETLVQILSDRVPQKQITEINRSLTQFIQGLDHEFDGVYSYRTPTDRQQMLKKNDVYNLIIQSFFSTRKLHKKFGDNWLEISMLSSGEKQKSIIDVAHSFLSNHRDSGSNLIIGIDEPESSLHMSACFNQFDALYTISRTCMQVIFTSHWYGFLPTIDSGSTTIITLNEDNNHIFDQLNLAGYREQIKQLRSLTKGKLPYDIRLKSINDFVQSIITSAMGDDPYNWIICEGTSEKIYLTAYLQDVFQSKKIRIVPVGGAGEIKRLYNHLSTTYEDFQHEITGKIILISDTDKELVRYEVKEYANLYCRRLVNDESSGITKLVRIDSNPISPATEIEDTLDSNLFLDTLKNKFIQLYPDKLSFLHDVSNGQPHKCSKLALDLRGSEWGLIDEFFNLDNNKFSFAKAYVENIEDSYVTPSWINEIRGWLDVK